LDETANEIRISGRDVPVEDLLNLLVGAFDDHGAVRFELRQTPSRLRAPIGETSVLVAIVAGGSAALSTLVGGLLKVIEKRQENPGKIVVKGSNGATIEFPAGTSPETLAELADLAKTLAEPRIDLHL
jgi:hypothetical protein